MNVNEIYVGSDGFERKIVNEGYVWIKLGGTWCAEHRYIIEKKLGRSLQKDEIVHHKNGNKLDNVEENLELTDRSEHMKNHFQDSNYRENQRISAIERMKDPELRKKLSHSAKQQWQQSGFRELMSLKLSEAQLKRYQDNPQERIIKSEQATQRWANPEIRAKMVASLTEFARERAKDPEYRKRLADSMRGRVMSPEAVETNRQQAKKRQQQVRLLYATYLSLGGSKILYWNRTPVKQLESLISQLDQKSNIEVQE